MIFSELEAFVNLFEKTFGFLKKKKNHNDTQTISDRFIDLFECHGIHRNQIPRVFQHELKLADVQSGADLLPKLTDEILDDACSFFDVNRDWIDGVNDEIYPTYDFYKYPNNFATFLDRLVKNGKNDLHGFLFLAENNRFDFDCILIIQETLGYIESKPYVKYHICNNWITSYWKSRAYLTACIAQCLKREIGISGGYVPCENISNLQNGKSFITEANSDIYTVMRRRFNAEEWLYSPDEYLSGVEPEINNFGIKSALSLWLELDTEGYMDTKFDKNKRKKFEAKAMEYAS